MIEVIPYIEEFLECIRKTLLEEEEKIERAQKRKALCDFFPDTATHDTSLFMTEDGQVWRRTFDEWIRLERESEERFARYKETAERHRHRFVEKIPPVGQVAGFRTASKTVSFSKRSLDCLGEEWTWEIGGHHHISVASVKIRCFELDTRQRKLQSLLSQEGEIASWMFHFGLSFEGSRPPKDFRQIEKDWTAFSEEFSLVYCNDFYEESLSYTLTKVLDLLVTGEFTRQFPLRA